MPYQVKSVDGGHKVTSPDHPQGFSKKPQSKAKAEAQRRAILANTDEEEPAHQKWAKKVKSQ